MNWKEHPELKRWAEDLFYLMARHRFKLTSHPTKIAGVSLKTRQFHVQPQRLNLKGKYSYRFDGSEHVRTEHLLRALIAHEAAHVQFSDSKPQGLTGDIWNCLEDERIERCMIRRYPALYADFAFIGDAMLERAGLNEKAPLSLLQACNVWRFAYDQPAEIRATFTTTYPQLWEEEICPRTEAGWEASREEVVQLAREIEALLPEDERVRDATDEDPQADGAGETQAVQPEEKQSTQRREHQAAKQPHRPNSQQPEPSNEDSENQGEESENNQGEGREAGEQGEETGEVADSADQSESQQGNSQEGEPEQHLGEEEGAGSDGATDDGVTDDSASQSDGPEHGEGSEQAESGARQEGNAAGEGGKGQGDQGQENQAGGDPSSQTSSAQSEAGSDKGPAGESGETGTDTTTSADSDLQTDSSEQVDGTKDAEHSGDEPNTEHPSDLPYPAEFQVPDTEAAEQNSAAEETAEEDDLDPVNKAPSGGGASFSGQMGRKLELPLGQVISRPQKPVDTEIEAFARQLAPLLAPPTDPGRSRPHRTKGRYSYSRHQQGYERFFEHKREPGKHKKYLIKIAIDISESMMGVNITAAQRAALMVVRAAELGHARIDVLAFNDHTFSVGEQHAPAQERMKVIKTLAKRVSGGTNVQQAVRYMLPKEARFDEEEILVIISDGQLDGKDRQICKALLKDEQRLILPILIGNNAGLLESWKNIFGEAQAPKDLGDICLMLKKRIERKRMAEFR